MAMPTETPYNLLDDVPWGVRLSLQQRRHWDRQAESPGAPGVTFTHHQPEQPDAIRKKDVSCARGQASRARNTQPLPEPGAPQNKSRGRRYRSHAEESAGAEERTSRGFDIRSRQTRKKQKQTHPGQSTQGARVGTGTGQGPQALPHLESRQYADKGSLTSWKHWGSWDWETWRWWLFKRSTSPVADQRAGVCVATAEKRWGS